MFSSSSVGVKPAPGHATKKSIVYEIIRQSWKWSRVVFANQVFKHSQKGASEGTIKAKHFLAFIAAKAGCGETSIVNQCHPILGSATWKSLSSIPRLRRKWFSNRIPKSKALNSLYFPAWNPVALLSQATKQGNSGSKEVLWVWFRGWVPAQTVFGSIGSDVLIL